MTVARECEIEVVDGGGQPLPNIKVSRGWAYGSTEKEEEKQTGPQGTAEFSNRVERHSFLGRLFAMAINVIVVHGDAHIDDEYIVQFPDGYTAEIAGLAPFKWVYEPGHLAKVDLTGLPRVGHYHIRFTIKKKAQ